VITTIPDGLGDGAAGVDAVAVVVLAPVTISS